MEENICCVCLKQNANVPVTLRESDNDSILKKLESIIQEVDWKVWYFICSQCVNTLDIVTEFKNLCLMSDISRKQQEKRVKNDLDETLFFQASTSDVENDYRGIDKPNSKSSKKAKIKEESNICSHPEKIKTCEKNVESTTQPLIKKEGTALYECEKCKNNFTSEKSFKRHCKTHDIFICFHCNKAYRRKVALAKHINSHMNIKVQCYACDTIFTSETLLIDHLKNIHDTQEMDQLEKVKCFKCGKTYKTQAAMLKHFVNCDGVKRHSKINFSKDISDNKCSNCGRFYTTNKILKVHEKNCKGCVLNQTENSQEFKCQICNVNFKSDSEKCDHVIREHSIDLKNENTCQLCYQHYLLPEELETHLVIDHQSKKETNKMCVQRRYTCEVCDKVFGFVKDIINHCVKEHQMEAKLVKPFLCNLCNTRFSSSANMIQHKEYHKGNRSHICTYCGKSYITKSDLIVHVYTHLNRRNYVCEICGRAFNTNKNLRSHNLVVHTDPNLWKYQCNICNKRFPLKSGFDQHLRRHSGDKRFKCLVCPKSFISNHELKKHTKSHCSKKTFKCSHCGKEYTDKKVYEIHLKKLHDIGDIKIPVRVKKFACHMCTSTFFDRHKLAKHLCTHTGIKPYPCSICEKRFADKSYLKHHLKVVHKVMDLHTDS